MLRIDIHDVGHGHCGLVTAPDGTRIMIDCGSDSRRGWWPSMNYKGQYVDLLILQNLDEDHVQDLPNVWSHVPLGGIFTNPTVTASALSSMKTQGMCSGVQFVHSLLSFYQPGVVFGRLPLSGGGGMYSWAAWNRYGVDCVNTNDLSLLTFVHYGDFTVLFAGDLERAGWKTLLQNPLVRAALPTVKLMVASRHGRKNGCSEDAFRLMRPDLVVFSDDAITYESQDTIGWYRQRTKSLPDFSKPFDAATGYPRRHVLTTRRDGSLTVNVQPNGEYLIRTERDAGTYFLPLPGAPGAGQSRNALALQLHF